MARDQKVAVSKPATAIFFREPAVKICFAVGKYAREMKRERNSLSYAETTSIKSLLATECYIRVQVYLEDCTGMHETDETSNNYLPGPKLAKTTTV